MNESSFHDVSLQKGVPTSDVSLQKGVPTSERLF